MMMRSVYGVVLVLSVAGFRNLWSGLMKCSGKYYCWLRRKCFHCFFVRLFIHHDIVHSCFITYGELNSFFIYIYINLILQVFALIQGRDTNDNDQIYLA